MKPKTLFIPLIKKEKLNKEALKNQLINIPNTIYIAYAIQYKKIAYQLKKELSKTHKISGIQQVLGCTTLKSKQPALLLADGAFHANNLLSQDNEVYLFDNHSLTKLKKQLKQGKLSKFYSSDKIGILISTKSGQYHFKQTQKVKEKLTKQNKKTYLFLSDIINTGEFENFNTDFWVNTACPGISSDYKKLINAQDIPE